MAAKLVRKLKRKIQKQSRIRGGGCFSGAGMGMMSPSSVELHRNAG